MFRPGTPTAGHLSRCFSPAVLPLAAIHQHQYARLRRCAAIRLSRATSVTSTAQQLSRRWASAVGAALLHLTLLWRGTEDLTAADFWPSFVIIGLISGASTLIFARLAADAGAEISGRGAPSGRHPTRAARGG